MLLPMLALLLAGCRSGPEFRFDDRLARYQTVSTEIEYPDAEVEVDELVRTSPRPFTVRDAGQLVFRDMSLQEAVQIALSRSQVIRDIGGRVVSAPASVATTFDPALQESNPATGAEAALSAFDAQFTTRLFVGQNDRQFNNIFIASGATGGVKQNVGEFLLDVSKVAATGTQFSLRNITNYDRSNSFNPLFNLFPGFYETVIEGEFRHPLLQGSGITFNRIAGPQARPGVYNGVLLARINTDVAVSDFEIAVRDLLREVERAYWQLYFAYRDLDAKILGRDAALETWQVVQVQFEAGRVDGERESLAREQYYAARAEVENALSGRLNQPGGVYAAERRLRFLLGLPSSDGQLIRPQDEPMQVDFRFDWDEIKTEAFWRRAELRRQQWNIKRRELELVAARNFGRMRLDLVGQYRWRGFGDDLLGNRNVPNGSAFQDLFTGDLQEWQFGLQLETPIGNRIGHAAIRHAELQLARERALYREQELQISHELSDVVAELDRAYVLSRSNYNRSVAALEQVQAIRAKYETSFREPGEQEILLETVLDAQSRAVQAASAYYESLADYNVALMELHAAKGTLLEYQGVFLSEGPWSAQAHRSAAKQSRRFRTPAINYCIDRPGPITFGAYPQRWLERPLAPEAAPRANDRPSDQQPPLPEALPVPDPAG